MRILLALSFLTCAAACGVDGPPKPPHSTTPGASISDVSISGEARMGVVGRL